MEDLILTINNKEFKAKFDKNDEAAVSINERPFSIELMKEYDNNIFSFAVDQKLVQVEFELSDSDNLIINYEGLSYEVDISNETKKLLEKFLIQSGAAAGGGAGTIKSPMPGMVVKILYMEGMPVSKGDNIIIIEAMKMENAIKAPVTGTVKKIHVSEGNAVEKDALLIEIEPGVN